VFWDNLSVPSSRIKKYKRENRACLKLNDTVFFLGLCPSSNFFKKHGVSEGSIVVGGTGDNMLWNDSEEDGNVRSKCEEDQGTDCEDRDSDTDWYR
jgi:hypothetical protein